MLELTIDKDEIIANLEALIDGMQKDVDPDNNSTGIKLSEARNLIIQKDTDIDKCKMEIIKLSENSTSHNVCLELKHKLEYEKVYKDLVKNLGDQIFITKKTELAFKPQTGLCF